ncbi:MAG TPA: hypothetical protein VIM73_11645 [Polyangiaceae bacterium]
MSATEPATVSLNLDAQFVEGASESIAAADALSAALLGLDEASERGKDAKFIQADKLRVVTSEMQQQASLAARIAAFDPARTKALAEQEKVLRKMREDALGITAENEKQRKLEEAKKAKEQADEILSENADRLEDAGGVLLKAGGIVLAAGAAIAAAAAALEKAGVEITSKHDVENAIGRHLGGDFQRSEFFALRSGLDVDQTWQETKKLLTAKFSQNEIETIVRIKAGMDASGENGMGFISELQRLKLEPKVNAADVKRLTRSGLDAKDVYAELAKVLGTDVAGAMARVKSGTVDSEKMIAAVEKVAGSGKFGEIADEIAKSVPAQLAHLKGDVAELFDFGPGALDGIKEALRGIIEVIESEDGVELREAFHEVFGELNHAFLDDFKGEEGKAKIREFAHDIATSIHEIAQAIHDVAPLIQFVERMGTKSVKSDAGKVQDVIQGKEGAGASAADLGLGAVWSAVKGGTGIGAVQDLASLAWGALGGHQDKAATAGGELPAGMAQGIKNNEHLAINAAGEMADKSVAEARRRLDAHSPSERAADEIGEPFAQGMALGVRRDSSPAAAGREMAAQAIAAAQGASTGGAVAASPAGPSTTINEGDIHLTIHAGNENAAKQWQVLLPDIQRAIRRDRRDAYEGANP